MKVIFKNTSLKFQTIDMSNLIREIMKNKCYFSSNGSLGDMGGFACTNKIDVTPGDSYHLSFGELNSVKVKYLTWQSDGTYIANEVKTAPLDITIASGIGKIAFNISIGSTTGGLTVLTEEKAGSAKLEANS